MQTYRLRESIVAESRDADGHMRIITLAAGAELTLKATKLESGLVDAAWQGQTIQVFIQDLKERADLRKSIG